MKRYSLLITCATLVTSLLEAGPVGSPGALNTEIIAGNGGTLIGDIDFTGNITFSSPRPALLNSDKVFRATTPSYTINGMGHLLINANSPGRRLFFARGGGGGTITIKNLTFSAGSAKGGDGSGGGMGAGGGLFIEPGASVKLDNVTFTGCSAVGGTGAASNFGGGGLGGNGGTVTGVAGGGGGGGFDGDGGSTTGSSSGAGGGGGLGDLGGLMGHGESASGRGGGRGGGLGLTPGAAEFRDAKSAAGAGGAGPGGGGGGGNGAPGANGGMGGTAFGGGGGGESATVGGGGDGGGGGTAGGGGGGATAILGGTQGMGGSAGDYGGGGGGGNTKFPGSTISATVGGAGGFGGGGGGAIDSSPSGGTFGTGGTGGFGGGGGFGMLTPGGGGFGGGSNGGGGAGFGGAIFMREGSTLTLTGSGASFSGNSTMGGAGGAGGTGGSAMGTDIFMMSSAEINVTGLRSTMIIPNPIESEMGVAPGGGVILMGGNTGTLMLTGANTYTGKTEVNSGNLYINGSVITSVDVFGGRFGGNATLTTGDLTVDGGRVVPGGDASFGNIFVGGDLTITDSGSSVEAEVDSVGNSDFIGVTGMASIDGTLDVTLANGNFLKGEVIPVISAAGGRTGEFSTVNIPQVNGTDLFSVQYTATNVNLIALFNSIFTDQCIDPGNPQHTAEYIVSLSPIDPNSELGFAVEVLGLLSDRELNSALNKLHPAAFGTLDWMNLTNNTHVTSVFAEHAHVLCCSPRRDACLSAFWIQPFGIFNRQSNLGQLRGFHQNSGGVAIGTDYGMDPAYGGVGGGYTYTDFNWSANAGRGEFHQLYAGAYGSTGSHVFTIDIAALVGANLYYIDRKIEYGAPAHPGAMVDTTARSKNWGMFGTGHLGITTCTFRMGGRIPAYIFAMGDYMYLKNDSFRERHANGLNMKVKQHKRHMVRTELGLNIGCEFNTCCGCWEPFGRVSWVAKIPIGGGHYRARYVGQSRHFRVNTTLNSVHQVAPELGIKGTTPRGHTIAVSGKAELSKRVKTYYGDVRFECTY